jgi:predicted membrane protein
MVSGGVNVRVGEVKVKAGVAVGAWRALAAAAVDVLVRPAVRVGVAQRAVTVQVAFDGLVGGGGHALQG